MAKIKNLCPYISEEDKKLLKSVSRNKEIDISTRTRANILLELVKNSSDYFPYAEIAKRWAVCISTVYNTINKYLAEGINPIITNNRNIASDLARKKFDGHTEALLLEVACGEVPEGHCRWTVRLLENHFRVELGINISRSSISRILKKTNFIRTKKTIGAPRLKKMPNL